VYLRSGSEFAKVNAVELNDHKAKCKCPVVL
jgi:hypothetical protein